MITIYLARSEYNQTLLPIYHIEITEGNAQLKEKYQEVAESIKGQLVNIVSSYRYEFAQKFGVKTSQIDFEIEDINMYN